MKKQVKEHILDLENEKTRLQRELNIVLNRPAIAESNPIDPKKDVLDREAKLCLLEECMSITAKFIFSKNENALDMISYTEWLDKLTREDLIGGLESFERAFKVFDEMTLTEIKCYFHEALVMLYERKKKIHIEMCNKLIADSKAKDK